MSKDQLAYLARLAVSPDGRALLNFLEARLEERDSKLRTSTGEEVLRAQGRALELAELIGDITGAQTNLARSDSSRTSSLRAAALNSDPRYGASV